MKFRSKSPIILLVSLILGACASTQLTPQQLNEQFPNLVKLEKELDSAKSNDIQLIYLTGNNKFHIFRSENNNI